MTRRKPRWPRDGDGRVSAREFVQALRSVVAKGGAVLPSQALALYRTAAEQGAGGQPVQVAV